MTDPKSDAMHRICEAWTRVARVDAMRERLEEMELTLEQKSWLVSVLTEDVVRRDRIE